MAAHQLATALRYVTRGADSRFTCPLPREARELSQLQLPLQRLHTIRLQDVESDPHALTPHRILALCHLLAFGRQSHPVLEIRQLSVH